MTPSIQLAVLRALTERPMTTQGVEKAVPHGSDSVRHALKQARKMGRVEYQGTCTRGGVYVLTAEGRRYLKGFKQCRDCRQEKPVTAFYKQSTERGTYRPECKACCNSYRNEWSRRHYVDLPPAQPDCGKRVLELMPRPV